MNCAIFRNLFIWRSTSNDAEARWTANNGSYTSPIAYGEQVIDGVDSGPIFDSSIRPAAGSTHTWKLIDGHDNFTYDAFYDSVNYWTSAVEAYKTGKAINNWERYDTGDNSNGHFSSLKHCDAVSGGTCNNWNPWTTLACWADTTSNVYKLNKIDDTENYVRQTGANLC